MRQCSARVSEPRTVAAVPATAGLLLPPAEIRSLRLRCRQILRSARVSDPTFRPTEGLLVTSAVPEIRYPRLTCTQNASSDHAIIRRDRDSVAIHPRPVDFVLYIRRWPLPHKAYGNRTARLAISSFAFKTPLAARHQTHPALRSPSSVLRHRSSALNRLLPNRPSAARLEPKMLRVPFTRLHPILCLVPGQACFDIAVVALCIANVPTLVDHKSQIGHDPASCECSQPFSLPPRLPPPFRLRASCPLNRVDVPQHQSVGTRAMALNLCKRLDLPVARDIGLNLLEEVRDFRPLLLELQQPLNLPINNRQQRGPAGRAIRRSNRRPFPSIELAFMELNPILVDLAPKLVKSEPKNRLEGVAREEHHGHLGIVHGIERLLAQQTDSHEFLTRNPARSILALLLDRLPQLEPAVQ